MSDVPTPQPDSVPTPPASNADTVAPTPNPLASTAATDTMTPPPAAPAPPKRGLAIAALILGIVALLGVALPVLNVFSALLAIVGLVLGIIALVKSSPRGLSLSGVIVSAVALLLSIIFIVVYTLGFASAIQAASDEVTTAEEEIAVDEEPVTEEPAEEEPAAEEPVASDEGTRDNPAPLGTTVVLTEGGEDTYEITLGAPTLNANDIVAAANQFNEPAPEGFQYAMVPVSVTYIGSDSGLPWIDITIEYVSSAGTTHTQSDASAVEPEPRFYDINELYTGASATGNVVILIPSADPTGGSWTISTLFSEPYFFTAQ